MEAPPGLAQNYASAGQQHSFDALQGARVGVSGQPTVSRFPTTSHITLGTGAWLRHGLGQCPASIRACMA